MITLRRILVMLVPVALLFASCAKDEQVMPASADQMIQRAADQQGGTANDPAMGIGSIDHSGKVTDATPGQFFRNGEDGATGDPGEGDGGISDDGDDDSDNEKNRKNGH